MITHRAQRNSNTVKVVDFFRTKGRGTVNDIVEATRLSRLTVAKILDRLAAATIVRADGKAPGRTEGGPKPHLYHFNPEARYSLGILIGEKSVCGRLVDLNIRTVARFRRAITLDARLSELESAIDELFAGFRKDGHFSLATLLGVGVGTQGVTDSERGVVLLSPHNPGWGSQLPLRALIQEQTAHAVPVHVDNAVRFRTLAETTAGMLTSVKNAQVIHCAEGLIAGNILDSSIYRGAHNFAGSIGHMKVNVNDREPCDCGGCGCFEMQVLPRRLLARAQELRGTHPKTRLFDCPDTSPDFDALVRHSEAGDPLARAVMDEAVEWFAIAIHNMTLMFDPEVVMIQGTYAHAGQYFLSSLRERVGKISLVNVAQGTRIEYSPLDDEEAGTLGAASYVLLHAFE